MNVRYIYMFFSLFVVFVISSFLPITSHAYIEDFENNIPGSWSAYGDGSWSVTSNTAQGGASSAQSPELTNSQSAALENIHSCISGNLTFYYKTSSEADKDKLQFYIDGELIDSYSGENDWTQASYRVTAGLHTFTWTYLKDLDFDGGEDKVWLDQISFPEQRLSAAGDTSYYIHSDATLWTWGSYTDSDSSRYQNNSPVTFGNSSVSDWIQVFSGFALKADGTLWGWGRYIGDGTSYTYYSPEQIGADCDWAQIAAGGLALKRNGTLWGWGRYSGDGTQNIGYNPKQIGTDNDWTQIATGSDCRYALKSDGTLWSWGSSSSTCGKSQTSSAYGYYYSPKQVGSDSGWAQISSGGSSSLALKTDGTLWAWGDYYGGDNYGEDHWPVTVRAPLQVGSNTNWIQATAGQRALIIKDDGTLWGLNNPQMFIDGSAWAFLDPYQIGNDHDWTQISGSYYHSLALKNNGTLWGWGANQYGQLGNITSPSLSVDPIPILGFSKPQTVGEIAPSIAYTINGTNVSLRWTSISDAKGYRLYYAPYPYTGSESIISADMGKKTTLSSNLWYGASGYITVAAHNGQVQSDISNIELFSVDPICNYRIYIMEGGYTRPIEDQLFYSQGGTGSIRVQSTNPLCSWETSSDSDWITMTNSGGTGSSDVHYEVSENASTEIREGTITVAGQTIQMSQKPEGNPQLEVSGSLNFGCVKNYKSCYLTVTNEGEGDLIIESSMLREDNLFGLGDSRYFSVSNIAGTVVKPGEKTCIRVSYSPYGIGDFQSTIMDIVSNVGSVGVSLSGMGCAQYSTGGCSSSVNPCQYE